MAYIGKVVAGGATHLVGSTLYGTCSTAAGTVAKVVVSTDFTELVTGVTIHIKFAETNTATSPTLTIQNAASNPTYTTGAKAIMKYGTTAAGTTAATSWYAGTVVALTYDGTNWIMNDHIDDTNTDTKNTAGSTDTSSKLFLIGATSQAASPQTYSQDTAYVGTDGCLYSGGTKVLTAHQDISGKVNKSGDTMTGRLTTTKAINSIITGSGTAAQDKGSGVSPRYFPAKWTFNTSQTATNGDIISIKIPVAGHDYGVYVSINNGANYHPVAVNGTGRLTTQYGNGTYVTLQFESGGSVANIYPVSGGDATTTVTGGCWRVINFYDSNSDTKVTQTVTTTNAEYEVLFSATADNTTRTEAARKSDKLKFNPSTGNLTATKVTTPTITLNGSDLGTTLSELTAKEQQNENNIYSLRAYGGLKNYATINNGTYTANSGGGTHSVTIPLLNPITGDIVISIGNITSNDVDSSTCAFVFENDVTSRDTVAVSRGDNINVPVSMGTFVATKVQIYPAATYQLSNGDTVSWTDLMICTKGDWDNSHDYQPYALSNATITPALQECVDNGVKNLVAISDSTITGSNYVFNNVPCNIPAGSYVFSYTSNQSIQGNVELVVKNSGGTTITSKTVTSSSGRVSIPFTISETGSKLTLYSVRAGTYSDIMVCDESLYDVSPTFEPYAMSNAELTSGVLYNTVTGVKNIVNIPDKTLTVSGYDVQDFAVSLPAGTYTFSFNGASLSALVFVLKSGDRELVRVNRAVTAGENHFNFTLYQTANTLNIWFNLATGATSGTITNHMICLKSLYDADPSYQPYALSNAELTAKEQQNESNILLKADKISFGFSGNPNPAVYVKDWDFVPDGTYLLTYICSQDASTRRGVSVYMFTKYTTNHIVLFTPVVEVSGAIITSCVASGSEGAETITFTMAQRGYHTAAAIQIQAF